MNEMTSPAVRLPGFLQALVCFGGIVVLLICGLFLFAVDLHVLMFLALCWAAMHARLLRHDYAAIRNMMSGAINNALPAIYIFLLIGMVIASFMHSGTIASLIYFGLAWLNPAVFLVAGLLLCALMSLLTGTSWGTAGTLGVVLIGVGSAMGLPLPLVAGVVVAGATFGDKLSPISDTTNLAAMSAGTSLYRHIGAMLYTTLPSFLIMALILVVIAPEVELSAQRSDTIEAMRTALAAHYGLSPLLAGVPLLVMVVLSVRRVAAEITMSAAVLAALLVAVFYQGESVTAVLNALWSNTPTDTGIASLDELLGRGGIASMSWTLTLALMALALGGILHDSGILNTLLAGLLMRIRRISALVATTIAGGFIGNLSMGEAYISIILNCQLFRQQFDHHKLDRAVLSRSVEEGATMTTGLIPWTTAGAFYAATLGVPVLEYAPWAIFNYLNAFVSVAMASLGLGLLLQPGQHSTGSESSGH